MKRTDILVIATCCVLAVVAGFTLKHCQRTLPERKCSQVYQRYAHVEGIQAAYVKDYRINDTLTIGVTLLEATTDSGWAMLQEDFGLPVIPKEYEERFVGDSNRVSIKKFPKDIPLFLDGDTLTDDLIIVSLYKHTICHFVIHSDEQFRTIMFKHLDDNTKKHHEQDN